MKSIILVNNTHGLQAILVPHPLQEEQLRVVHDLAESAGLRLGIERSREWQVWGAFVRPTFHPATKPTGQTLVFSAQGQRPHHE